MRSSSSDSGRSGPPRLTITSALQLAAVVRCGPGGRRGTGRGRLRCTVVGHHVHPCHQRPAPRVLGQLIGEVVQPDAEAAAAEQPGGDGIGPAELCHVAGQRARA